jgi:uncharacterized protein YdaU (DUF1376 family)
MLPWFVRDYIAATRHLSLAERGAYTDLLFLSWEQGPLPKDPVRLARMVGCGAEEFAQVWPALTTKFTETEAGLVNDRLEEHREKSVRLSAERAAAGRVGGKQSAKQRASKSEAIASDLPEANGVAKINPPSPSPSPSPIPDPSPDSPSPTETRPLARTARSRPAYEGGEFHDQVKAAYHEVLPDLPTVKVWSRKRAQALNARIQERCRDGKPADTIDYWRQLFGEVAASDFLCGRSSQWRADLEWLLRPENFAKVIEGRYATRTCAPNGSAGHAR